MHNGMCTIVPLCIAKFKSITKLLSVTEFVTLDTQLLILTIGVC